MLRTAVFYRVVAPAFRAARYLSGVSLNDFATIDPGALSPSRPGKVENLVAGEWRGTAEYAHVPDPLTGGTFLHVPRTHGTELEPFIRSLSACSKSGLHNPLKKVERYLMYGDVSARAAASMRDEKVADFFARLIQRVSPKSYAQAMGEVKVTRLFLENFSGDQVRFMARSQGVSGDHVGQQSVSYRWPYGPVAVIAPFNFPLEIPALQMMGALYMGNKPLVKCDSKVSTVLEQFVRLLHACGMPKGDADVIHADGPPMNELLMRAQPRNTLFTGSAKVAEKLALDLHGRLFVEDAGFDWKILGPDVDPSQVDYVAWQSDQDAYACSGQKCSAQSILFVHEAWAKTPLLDRMKALAQRRKLQDLTVGPLLSVTTKAALDHVSNLKAIPGARVLWGGAELSGHSIPPCYGALQPTAVFVPLKEMLKPEHFAVATKELFGPLQVVTQYCQAELPLVLEACERMDAHLTAAVVSNDALFLQTVLGQTVNGTTYAGARARTTGAPQNHWFGPAGDPRAAGIGTPDAIRLVWSCHREIIQDVGPLPKGWSTPPST